MPQKKNPDIPELVRGKSGRVFGDLMALLTLMKSLPLAYNRDMQEDKEPLFNSVDILQSCLDIYIRMIPRLEIDAEAMRRAASKGFLNATDMADYLVKNGMAFRKAHDCVGKAVGFALSQGKELHELALEELQQFSQLIKEDIFEHLTVEAMVNRRTSAGGTAGENVMAAVEKAEADLEAEGGAD
jgi:argininosuccinate lyase